MNGIDVGVNERFRRGEGKINKKIGAIGICIVGRISEAGHFTWRINWDVSI